jgi:drug/metabolite transporter (DMT)-like permease
VTPNLMALAACGFEEMVHGRFENINEGIKPYVDQIITTSRSVLEERDRIDTSAMEGMFRRTPAINIFLPSMFHNVENLLVPKHFDKAERKKFQSSLNILTRQTGYGFPVNTEHQLKAISGLTHEQISAKEAPFAPHPLFQMRQLELSLATESLGALAASEVSATLRPPNAVNRTEGTTRLGLILITVSAVAWSTAGLFTRLIPLDSWTMLVWRGLFGALGIAVVILALERRNALASFQKMNLPSWLYAALGALAMVFYITSLRHTSVAHVAVIYATAPFLAAALGRLIMREKPGLSAIAASLAALAGVVVMVGFGIGLFGDLLAFGMTLSMAVIIIVARHSRNIPVMPVACMSALLSGLVCWPLGAPLAVSSHELLLLAAFGLVNSALGLALFTLGARLLPATETALIGSLDAPLAPLWVWLVFNETPSGSTMTGGAIVFVAVAAHLIAGVSQTTKSSS